MREKDPLVPQVVKAVSRAVDETSQHLGCIARPAVSKWPALVNANNIKLVDSREQPKQKFQVDPRLQRVRVGELGISFPPNGRPNYRSRYDVRCPLGLPIQAHRTDARNRYAYKLYRGSILIQTP
ncbi:hypothetical protein CSUB01_09081 [Colletotrichum sublineola]|uniref:Uncharacterized protein n=1 Tax=Colletotrichum sublineola TaxID=1173701 RepID=A0A066XZX5_COLSU|nr:hypothetical protein CSUB01_09081 [Colletotrichum sublineola]